MSVVDQAKEIAGLIKTISDIELYRKIVELEGEIIELTRSKRELEDARYNLEKQLALKRSMTFRTPFFFQNGDEAPFCHNCWEKYNLPVHMNGYPPNEPIAYECTACFVKSETRRFESGAQSWCIGRHPARV